MFFLSFLFLLVLTGLSFLSKWEKLNIDNIEVTGNKIIETKMIEEIAKEKISGSYFGIFPKTNFLLYPKRKIAKELEDKFKRLKDISLNVRNLKILEIALSEREGLYTYCGAVFPEPDNGNKCYFLDNEGYIFDEAPSFSEGIYLKFYGRIDKENPAGSYFFQSLFKKLIFFKETLEKMDIKPVVFYLEEGGDIKVFLASSSQTGPELIFKKDSDFEKVLENLQSVLSTEPLQAKWKSKYSSLLYIDLRFGNKVYYKFK